MCPEISYSLIKSFATKTVILPSDGYFAEQLQRRETLTRTSMRKKGEKVKRHCI